MPNQTMVYSCSAPEQEYTMVWFGIFLYLIISSLKIRFCEQSVFAKSPLFINHKSFFPNVYFIIISSGCYPLVTPFLPARLGRMSRIKASGTGSFACITNICQTSEKSQTLGKSQTCAANWGDMWKSFVCTGNQKLGRICGNKLRESLQRIFICKGTANAGEIKLVCKTLKKRSSILQRWILQLNKISCN